MRIVCCIPARGGSKGVPNKNGRMLCGQPLLAYPIVDSIRVKEIQATYVSTDSQALAEIALQYGAEVPFLRPAELAKDTSLDIDWALHFLDWYEERYSILPDYIVHLRTTTPFRKIELISEAIEKIKQNPDATSLISVEEAGEPFKSFLFPKGETYLKPLFELENHLLPRQNFPSVYTPNGYVDILKTSRVIKGDFHGDKIIPFIVPKVPEIDTLADWDYAEWVGSKII